MWLQGLTKLKKKLKDFKWARTRNLPAVAKCSRVVSLYSSEGIFYFAFMDFVIPN
jgi:hypothetical protein